MPQSCDGAAARDDFDICDFTDDLKHRINRGGTRVEQPAFASRRTTLLDVALKPLVVVDRAGQEPEGDLIDRTAGPLSQPNQLGSEFWRNLQVHEVGVMRVSFRARPRPQACVLKRAVPAGQLRETDYQRRPHRLAGRTSRRVSFKNLGRRPNQKHLSSTLRSRHYAQHDVTTYERWTAQEFVRVTSSGRVIPRGEWLKTDIIENQDKRVPSVDDDVKVRIFDDVAVITGWNITPRADGAVAPPERMAGEPDFHQLEPDIPLAEAAGWPQASGVRPLFRRQALSARAAGRSAGVGTRRALAGSVTTVTVSPVRRRRAHRVRRRHGSRSRRRTGQTIGRI